MSARRLGPDASSTRWTPSRGRWPRPPTSRSSSRSTANSTSSATRAPRRSCSATRAAAVEPHAALSAGVHHAHGREGRQVVHDEHRHIVATMRDGDAEGAEPSSRATSAARVACWPATPRSSLRGRPRHAPRPRNTASARPDSSASAAWVRRWQGGSSARARRDGVEPRPRRPSSLVAGGATRPTAPPRRWRCRSRSRCSRTTRRPRACSPVGTSGGRRARIHVNTASISAATADRLEQRHAEAGTSYVSSPVLGRPAVAAQGNLNLMAAGPVGPRGGRSVARALSVASWRFGEPTPSRQRGQGLDEPHAAPLHAGDGRVDRSRRGAGHRCLRVHRTLARACSAASPTAGTAG